MMHDVIGPAVPVGSIYEMAHSLVKGLGLGVDDNNVPFYVTRNNSRKRLCQNISLASVFTPDEICSQSSILWKYARVLEFCCFFDRVPTSR